MAEKEYIAKEFVIDAIEELKTKPMPKSLLFDHLTQLIEIFPTEDFAPVKHGHWIYQSSRKYINTDINEEKLQKEILGYGGRVILNLQCSVCRKVTMVCNSISYEYCPHCGAKMDG